jgi:DNA polymerase III gamma/tau subunit
MIELYRKYRPTSFDDVVGNETAIKALKKELENGSHVFLLTGNAGCGKTTLARIMAKEVGAGDLSIREINSAENRGIDTAREVMEQMRYNPSDGDSLVWIFDECFHKDTLIDTLRGRVKISEVTPNELVFNSDGVTRVETVQKKKVDVNRLAILTTNYGQLLTTCEHLFYTNRGFVKAEKLVKGDVLYDIQDMPNMWKGISNISVNKFRNLRKSLWWVATQTERVIGETEEILFRYEREKQERIDLPSVWEDFYSSGKRPSEVLFDILQSYWTKAYNGSISESGMCDLWERIQREALEQEKDLFKKLSVYLDGFDFCWQEMFGKEKTTDDRKQSVKKSLCLAKDERYKNEEWNAAYLEWKAWRERSVYERADDIIQTAGGGLVFGTSYKNNEKITISDELQGRYRESIFEDCDRSGRSDPQFSEATCVGLKENEFAGSVRVESVEIYQSTDKSKSFRCYFTDKELSDGVVDMYDLGVEGSPTYYANGLLVHNCHQWLAPVQNAFLKALEDTPEHVYFFLCTTDPQKLIAPLKTRCSTVNVSPLDDKEMTFLLKRTARAEGKKLTPEITQRICELAQGGSRTGLKLLGKVLFLDSDEERMEALKVDSDENSQTIELCRALLAKDCTSAKLLKLLKTLDLSNSESVRQAVMGYMNSVLLSGRGSPEAVCAMQAFSNADTYRNGKFAITVAILDFINLLG